MDMQLKDIHNENIIPKIDSSHINDIVYEINESIQSFDENNTITVNVPYTLLGSYYKIYVYNILNNNLYEIIDENNFYHEFSFKINKCDIVILCSTYGYSRCLKVYTVQNTIQITEKNYGNKPYNDLLSTIRKKIQNDYPEITINDIRIVLESITLIESYCLTPDTFITLSDYSQSV